MRNLHLLFNKIYYSKLGANIKEHTAHIKGVHELLTTNATFDHSRDYVQPPVVGSQSFVLKIAYPGLLVGIGNSHNAGMSNDEDESEVAVGFSFDYVTGQPYIPGSTVKGVLRSHFKDHPEAVAAIADQSLEWVKAQEQEIFENGDVFFDAVVYDGNKYGELMGFEAITPHGDDPCQNPVPIKMIKVLPDVRFSFRFLLKDSKTATAEMKQALFMKLICYYGIGAKTNVGFGIFEADPSNGKIEQKTARRASEADGSGRQRNNRTGRTDTRSDSHGRGKTPQSSVDVEHFDCSCGKRNYRFYKDSSDERWNWKQNKCFNCGGKLR